MADPPTSIPSLLSTVIPTTDPGMAPDSSKLEVSKLSIEGEIVSIFHLWAIWSRFQLLNSPTVVQKQP